MTKRILLAMIALASPALAAAQEKAITPEQLEFFEKKVRPVLAQHCFECHSSKAKRPKGGFLLDSRAGMIEGGDLGSALSPGHPEKSRIIEAISHKNVKFKMPQKYKLPDAVIADLTEWVKMGAPWPDAKVIKKNTYSDFDLAKRKKEHWSWRPIVADGSPEVKDKAWAQTDVDRFLLAKLEGKGLKPAPAADPRTLIRRVYFDIIGLPPPRDAVEAFVKAWDGPRKREEVFAEVVDHLLDSPQYGERWARHWLDLVRYAESRGHEFDYTIPNAFQYRDYVIRAFNADVPYNQFVREHIAGDLLQKPRMHPLTPNPSPPQGRGEQLPEGFNESILGTAFWFLGEECHSPVDIRQDQADRFDNRIDVLTKTFLGLTVACARCHDHKFDAISTKDYYALFGILESSNYRLARFDTMLQHRRIAEDLRELRQKSKEPIQKAFVHAISDTLGKMDKYLLSAANIDGHSAGLDPALLDRWRKVLSAAVKDPSSPLHVFALAAVEKKKDVQSVIAPIVKSNSPAELPVRLAYQQYFRDAETIVDFGDRLVNSLLADDISFLSVRPGDIFLGTSPTQPITRMAGYAVVERDRIWDAMKLAPGTQNESGSLGGMIRSGRTLRTPEFTLKNDTVFVEVNGTGMIYAAVGQHVMLSGPLHGSLIQKFNTNNGWQWIAFKLGPYRGQRAHLEFTPGEGSNFEIGRVLQAPNPPPTPLEGTSIFLPRGSQEAKTLKQLATTYQRMFVSRTPTIGIALHSEMDSAVRAPVANWIFKHADLFIRPDSDECKQLVAVATPILDEHKKLLAQIKPESRLTPAMQDGSGTDSHVFIRGNPKTPGELVPRRYLEALAGPERMAIKSGSGRLELAEMMTDPKTTPHITRVYVNRVWHHLFGRGIVASVDNFGVLGDLPTHPELLDFLAHKFDKDGWSTKKLIRSLVLTNAYQMASTPDPKVNEVDPGNLLLHRMRTRRLEGEAIRDSILTVSGRLNATMYGPSIPVHLTEFQEGRGRPASGPLDGDGRRSVYLAVRRNFLSSFLLAFDTPSPFSTVGRRTVSNVPAQALILMNDPFMHKQAEIWANRVIAEKTSNEERVRGMFLDAFARPPSEIELRNCVAYLGASPDLRRWADLAHVVINAKEFCFVN